jgi:hypothetical protein
LNQLSNKWFGAFEPPYDIANPVISLEKNLASAEGDSGGSPQHEPQVYRVMLRIDFVGIKAPEGFPVCEKIDFFGLKSTNSY